MVWNLIVNTKDILRASLVINACLLGVLNKEVVLKAAKKTFQENSLLLAAIYFLRSFLKTFLEQDRVDVNAEVNLHKESPVFFLLI